MSISRRKSALMKTILGMDYSDENNEDEGLDIDASDELTGLNDDDLDFLDDEQYAEDAGDDVELNVEDIVGCADNDGKVKMSSIRALADAELPDDLDEDEIVGDEALTATDEDIKEFEASLEEDALNDDDELDDENDEFEASLEEGESDEDLPEGIEGKKCSARIRRTTARLDKLANYCERVGNKRLAYKIDMISDKLDKH